MEDNAKYWLYQVLSHPHIKHKKIPLLIIANKQDQPNAMSGDELGLYLGIYKQKYDVTKYYNINKLIPRSILHLIFDEYIGINIPSTIYGKPVHIFEYGC